MEAAKGSSESRAARSIVAIAEAGHLASPFSDYSRIREMEERGCALGTA